MVLVVRAHQASRGCRAGRAGRRRRPLRRGLARLHLPALARRRPAGTDARRGAAHPRRFRGRRDGLPPCAQRGRAHDRLRRGRADRRAGARSDARARARRRPGALRAPPRRRDRARVRGRRGRRRAGLGRRLLAARPARAAARARRAAHVRALQRALQAAARPLRPAGADRCGRPRGLAALPPVREHRCDRPLRRTRRGQLDRAGRPRPGRHAGRLRDLEHRAAGARAVARDVVPLLRPTAGRGDRRSLPRRAGDDLAAARRRARDRRCGASPSERLHERRESRRLLASRAPTGNDVALEEAIFARGRGCDTRAARSPDARRRQPRNRPGAGAAQRPAGLHAHGPARRQLEPALGARERAPAAARAHAGRTSGSIPARASGSRARCRTGRSCWRIR